MSELLVFGEINPDVVVTGVPDLAFGQREDETGPVTMTVGSSVAILACGAARLGTQVDLVGVVGDDPFGDFMLARLAERGVGTGQVRVVPGGRTGSSVILVRAADPTDRQILTDLGVMPQLRASDAQLAALPGLRHLHVGSWFLQRGALDGLPGLLAQARARGLTTSVDPNDDPEQRWDSGLPGALAHVDVLFCNEPEARGLSGAGSAGSALDAARSLLSHLPPTGTVVLKAGEQGAVALSASGEVQVPAPRTAVVDTIGAGDTLAAAFLMARLRGRSVGESLRLAVAAGSLSTRASGGVAAQPTLAEAEASAATLQVRGVEARSVPARGVQAQGVPAGPAASG